MQVVQSEWPKLNNNYINNNLTIIFTTESKDMIQQQERYYQQRLLKLKQQQQNGKSKQQLQLRFVVNPHDVREPIDTGNHVGSNPNADEDLLLAIAAIQLQLYSSQGLTIANCCSNFATVMKFLLEGGFGSTSGQHSSSLTKNTENGTFLPKFVCLQDTDDPRLRPCCWKDPKCRRQKDKDTKAFLEDAAAAVAAIAAGNIGNNNHQAKAEAKEEEEEEVTNDGWLK